MLQTVSHEELYSKQRIPNPQVQIHGLFHPLKRIGTEKKLD
jgi:hypothetical protein